MKTCFIVLFFIIGFWSCKPSSKKSKIYYIDNSKSTFECKQLSHDSVNYLYFETTKKIVRDTNWVGRSYVSYSLWHYSKRGKYRDTTFVKHKSYIDSIEFYGSEWLNKKENLDKFWIPWSGWPDSLKIYLFEPIKGTDSLIFRRVHRFYDAPDD